MKYVFRTKDCPDVAAGTAQVGDSVHTMTFPLADEGQLTIQMGETARKAFLKLLRQQKDDDERDFQIMCGRLLRRLPENDPVRVLAHDLIRRKGSGSIMRETTTPLWPTHLNTQQGLRDAAEAILGLQPGRPADPHDGSSLDDWFEIPEDVWIAVVMIVGRWLHDGPDRE